MRNNALSTSIYTLLVAWVRERLCMNHFCRKKRLPFQSRLIMQKVCYCVTLLISHFVMLHVVILMHDFFKIIINWKCPCAAMITFILFKKLSVQKRKNNRIDVIGNILHIDLLT